MGEITLTSITPASGASVAVAYCPEIEETCTDEVEMTFGVRLSRDLNEALLQVGFYAGPLLCAFADTSGDLKGGNTSLVSVSDVSMRCPLPATTDRIVAELKQRPVTLLLSQEFSHAYIFTKP